MKSCCASALLASASVLLAVGQAAAQYAAPSLLPLPPVTAVDAVTTSFDLPGGNMDAYGSVFARHAPESIPDPTPDTLIDGAQGESKFAQAARFRMERLRRVAASPACALVWSHRRTGDGPQSGQSLLDHV